MIHTQKRTIADKLCIIQDLEERLILKTRAHEKGCKTIQHLLTQIRAVDDGRNRWNSKVIMAFVLFMRLLNKLLRICFLKKVIFIYWTTDRPCALLYLKHSVAVYRRCEVHGVSIAYCFFNATTQCIIRIQILDEMPKIVGRTILSYKNSCRTDTNEHITLSQNTVCNAAVRKTVFYTKYINLFIVIERIFSIFIHGFVRATRKCKLFSHQNDVCLKNAFCWIRQLSNQTYHVNEKIRNLFFQGNLRLAPVPAGKKLNKLNFIFFFNEISHSFRVLFVLTMVKC